MLNNFIYAQTKELFLNALNDDQILDEAIVFIEDTKEIGNRGHYFGGSNGSEINPEIISELQTAIAALQSNKVDKNELADYAKKNELPSLDEYLTKTAADGLYATIAQYNALNQTVGNIQTELSSKLTSSDLADYAKTADVPTKISDLTDDSDFITNAEATAAYAPKSLVTTVSDQATTISTLATKDELSTGLAGKLDNSAASGFVPTTRKVNGVALDTDITITATDPNAATKDSLNNVNTDLQNFKNSVALTYATDKDVADAIANLVDSSPETLNTLDELAAALGDDPNFATTVSNLIGTKASQDDLDDTNTNVANLMEALNKKLDKTGGTITGALQIRRGASQNYITFENANSTPQGYLGFNGNNNPIYIPSEANTIYTLLHSGNANKTDVPWAASNILFPKGTSATWNVHTTDAYKGITVLNAVQAKPEGAPDHYAVGLSVSGYYGFTLASLGGGDVLLYRRSDSTTQTDWKTIAFTDSNVASATKLETPRTIWGQSFDGTGNVDGKIYQDGRWIIGLHSDNNLYVGYDSKSIGSTLLFGRELQFYDSIGNRTMHINSSGNVGIGITDPQYKLDVDGIGRFSVGMSANEIILGSAGIYKGSYYTTALSDSDILYNARYHVFNGNVGIGTTDPSYKLDVNGSFNATSGNINGNAIIHSGNIGSQSVNYANSAGTAKDQTARDAAAAAQSTANGKWTYNESTIKAVKVNNSETSDYSNVLNINNTEYKYGGGLQYFQTHSDTTINPDSGGGSVLRTQHPGYTNGYGQEMAYSFSSDTIKFRRNVNGSKSSWKTIAFTDSNITGNAATATNVAWTGVTGKPSFATVATSGSYTDLSNKPTIPTNTNQLINGAGFITGITKAMVTTALGYTPPTTNTTYSAATTSADGLMSKSDKSKLDGIASGATAVSSSTVSGGGFTKNTGTVTSVAMTVPTGLSVSGTPITTSGTLALSFASGYSIPTTAKQGNWDTAYGGGNHASAGYVKSSGVTSVATGTGLTGGTITGTGTISINTTYQGYITNGNNAWASHTKLAANKINAIPVTHKVVTCPISAAGTFGITGTMTAGQVIHVIVQNTTTSAITVTIPNSGSYHSFSGTSLSVPASKYAEINVVYNGEKMFIRTAY